MWTTVSLSCPTPLPPSALAARHGFAVTPSPKVPLTDAFAAHARLVDDPGSARCALGLSLDLHPPPHRRALPLCDVDRAQRPSYRGHSLESRRLRPARSLAQLYLHGESCL